MRLQRTVLRTAWLHVRGVTIGLPSNFDMTRNSRRQTQAAKSNSARAHAGSVAEGFCRSTLAGGGEEGCVRVF